MKEFDLLVVGFFCGSLLLLSCGVFLFWVFFFKTHIYLQQTYQQTSMHQH